MKIYTIIMGTLVFLAGITVLSFVMASIDAPTWVQLIGGFVYGYLATAALLADWRTRNVNK